MLVGHPYLVKGRLYFYGGADSAWDLRAPQFYIIVVLNILVFFAFTGLLKFYYAVHEYIERVNPFQICV